MTWFDIFALIILFFSLLGGLKEGAVKNFFSLLALIIAIPLAGRFYHIAVFLLSFLPGTNWENFIGFFITLGLVSVAFHLAFFLPRKIIEKVWGKGVLFRLLGGALNLLNAGIGMVVFALALKAYPIFDWLVQAVAGSGVVALLMGFLGFVQALLPEAFRISATVL